jgi:hypothetical protein
MAGSGPNFAQTKVETATTIGKKLRYSVGNFVSVLWSDWLN